MKHLFLTKIWRFVACLLLLAAGTPTEVHASHAAGADISYQCINAATNQYVVTVRFYRDCNGITSSSASLNIASTSSNCTGVTSPVSMTLVSGGANGTDVSQLCGTAVSTCSGGTNQGTSEYVYRATVTLPSGCDSWRISYASGTRSSNITNLTNAGNVDWYYETIINTATAPCNSSPQFSSLPVLYTCAGQTTYYNHGAIDPDGDSLAFSLVQPRSAQNTTIAYASGLSATVPLRMQASTTFNFNPTTGQMVFTPLASTGQVAVIAVQVREFRNGVLIGTTLREVQVVVLTNCTNQSPTPGTVSTPNGVVNGTTINVCGGNVISFSNTITDPNTSDVLSVTSNIASVIPGATYIVAGTNPVVVTFTVPTAGLPSGRYAFTITSDDNACPVSSNQIIGYELVLSNLEARASMYLKCANKLDTIQLEALGFGGAAAPGTYSWTPTTHLSSSSVYNPIATIQEPDTFYVTYVDGVCIQTDTVFISAPYPAEINPIPDVTICNGNTAQLTASVALGAGGASFTRANRTDTIAVLSTRNFPITVSGVAPSTILSSTVESVCLNISQRSVRDINVYLISPSGQMVELTSANGPTSQTALTNVCFSPSASTPITNYSSSASPAIVAGSYLPEGAWSNWTGGQTNGTWILRIVHTKSVNLGGQNGILNSVTINFNSPLAATFTWSPNYFISCTNCASPIVAPQADTTYQVVAQNIFGCRDTALVRVNVDSMLPSPVLSCDSIGFDFVRMAWQPVFGVSGYQLTVNGGTPFTVSPSSLSYSQGNIPMGQCVTLSVVPISGNSCQNGAATVLQCCPITCTPGTVIASITASTNALCAGTATGTATASGAGGTGVYRYIWSAGNQTTATATGLAAGIHCVTVADQNNCFDVVCVTISEPSTVTLTTTSSDATCNGGSNGFVTVAAAGGTGVSYNYLWNTGATTALATGLPAGTYTVTVSDQNACISITSTVVSEPSSISVTSAVISDVQCNGGSDGVVTTTVNGGTPNYNYAWSNGATTATATGLTAGSYCVTVSDVNSCTATICATVSEPSALSISTSSVDVTCFGGNNGSGSSTVSGGVTPYVYAWSNGATTANLTGLTAGTYDISVTDAHNCQIISTITINQPAASVSVTASSTTALCAGGSTGTATAVALGGIAPHQYLWSANSGSQTTATATGLLAGNYTVTATDNNGCAAATTVVVNDGNGIQISLTSTDASCNGYANGTATAAANGGVGGFTYHWDNGQSTATAVGLVANNYCVTATDANGCGVTGCVLVSQPQGMSNVQFTTQSVSCFGGNDGRATVTLVGGIRPYQYVWDNGTTGATGTGFNAGNHSVTISDANGCTISGTALVPQPTQLQVTAQSDSARCRFNNDGAATATATGGTFPYNYLWSNGRNTAYNGNIIAGTYRVTVTDLNGCTATSGTTVGQPSSAVIANIINSQNASCNGLANGQAEVNGTGGTPNYTYVWTNGQTNSVATGLAAGNHRVTVTDQRGCTASASVNISQPTALQATASITSNYNGAHVSCTGDNDGTARVIVTGGTGAYGYAWSTAPAQLTAIATGLTAGTYTVTVTDASGCSLTRSVTLQNPTPLQATEQHVNVFCHGQATGQIIVTATPNTGTVGINGYEYAIYGPNQTGNVFSNVNQYFGLVAGTYTVIVRDGNDCEVPVSIQITEPTILTVQTSKTDATCHTSSTGTATATPTGGTSPYRYAWSNGQTSQTATGLTAGSYQVTVTDNNGCDISQSVLINQPTALQASVTPASASCNGSTNGSAAVVATGGTSPYRYRWTNNQTAGTANGMAVGSYQVTVTDAQGCTVVVPFTITEPTGLTVAVAPQHLTCFNGANGQATATPAGGTAPYTYAWLNGQTTATITGLSAGVQRVIITDANGCQAQAQTTLTQPAIVTGSITAQTATRCANSQDGTATAQGAGGTAPFSYRWSNGQTAAIATGLASNTVYTVTISDANGCNTAITTTIPNPSALAINNTTHQDVLCKGDATGRAVVLAIGGTMPYSYMWSNSQTAAVATGLTAGLYSVTVSDANGCATATQISIAEPTQGLSLLVNATPTLCANDANGQAAAIPAGGTPFTGNSYQYRWSNGRTSRDISGLAAGTYTVTVTDANGCSISRTTTVTNGGTVRIQTQVLQQPTCGGGTEGRAIVTASSSNGGNVAFLWSNGATSQTVTGLTAGTYTVTATDTTGCAAMDSVVINDGTRVTDQVTIQPISCFGQADGAITMQTTPAAVIYEWNTGFVGVTGALTNLAAGQYTVTITTAQGCRKAFTYTVTQPDSFTVALAQTQTIACYQDATAAIQSTVQGGTQPVTYAWNTGANTGNISQLSAGGYTLLVTDANGCTATAQLAIGEPAQLVLTLDGTETTCSDSRDGMIALSATGGTLNAGLYEYSLDSIRWQTGNLFPNLASGSYTVLVRDANGCTDLDTLTIQPTAPFFIVAATADTTLEYLDTVQLAVTLNDTTQATSVWTLLGANGGVLDTNVYQVIVVPANTGSYHFVAMNQNGCQVDTTIILTVAKPRNANAPKGFTPNGDGTNDTFFIQGDDKIKSVLAFRVYDRWGELVYEATDLQPNDATAGWDGTLKGKPLNSGVFAWYAEIQYNDGFTVVTKGDVTLLR